VNVIPVIVAVAILAAVAFGIVWGLRLEKPYLQPVAILRAVVQLAVLTIILAGVISNGWWVAVFLVVMIGAATWVVVRRLDLRWLDAPIIAGIILTATSIPAVIIFLTGAVDFTPRFVLAVGGIVVGNAMTVCTLMGRTLAAGFVSQRDEIEGWLALGATPRVASIRAVRIAASTALIPSTDQTRTTGIVTLPGAFIGAIFAGASVLIAAEFQLLVLSAILVTGGISVALLSWRFGAPRVIPIGALRVRLLSARRGRSLPGAQAHGA
jgi:putative ABC transport system permease protein